MNKSFLPFALIFSLWIVATCLKGQENLAYQLPAQEILDLVDAPLSPQMSISSSGQDALLLYRKAYKSIAELSDLEMRLAGLRINPRADIGSRQRYYYDIKILNVTSKKTMDVIGLPQEPRLTYFEWSPDESKVAFVHNDNEDSHLYILDVKTQVVRRLSTRALNANMGQPYIWHPNSQSLLVASIPESRDELIKADEVIPTGPTISVNDGKKAQNRTYQDLLKNGTDEFNFQVLAESEIVEYRLTGESRIWKSKAMHSNMSYSPDGSYVLINTVHRPFSYIVPYYRFPQQAVVYSSTGRKIQTIMERPLVEDLPKGFMAVVTGRRDVDWRDDQPSTLVWVEALDGGDPEVEVSHRDAVYTLEAPFDTEPVLQIKTIDRFYKVDWAKGDVAFAYDYWWNSRNTRTYLFNPSDPIGAGRIISDRNYQDRYNDPGEFAMVKNQYNRDVVLVNDYTVYLMGDGYSDKGVYPFIDAYQLDRGVTSRMWQASDSTRYERIIKAMDLPQGRILTRIEGKTTFPNYYFRNIQSGLLEPITQFPNPFQAMEEVYKEVITYQREDGIDLSGTLYLPPGFDRNDPKPLPMLLWAYPVEFKDKSSAGQITTSPNEFTYPWYGSPIYWVLRGYVVLDDASFPILGEGDEEPNDSFRKQLVANGKAAIDAVDALGYIDRRKVGVGGHSYGAFMTANLLSHSDLFAAGIARSGAYNRTLTPFGFQSEERNYWEAPEVYYNMSPFMHADKMKTPLLLIHGEEDNNSGTYPMQSERYFNALKGLGATVRLVMLPKESHGYAARESILHMLWEQDTWLETYVKNRPFEDEKQVEQPVIGQ